MSKPISFGFGKPKASAAVAPSKSSTSISLPTKKPASTAKLGGLKSRSALQADDDDGNDDEQPVHEEVTGFSSTGVILSKPIEEKKAIVIQNQGNGDWRNRGRGGNRATTSQERSQKEGQDVVMIEKNEVSTASGLQFAPVQKPVEPGSSLEARDGTEINGDQNAKPKTADEEALQALLSDDPNAPRGNAIISVSANKQLRPADELDDFRSDVASRPEAATLDEYAAMPVEEFGFAMLRGMGKKRKANGEVVNVEPQPENKKEIKKPKHEGFLGIGAKPAPGLEGVELGAWGKADMRKNNRGQGFFTPVMIRDKETGETITEEELERRKREKSGKPGTEEDWRDRRDRNLEKDGDRRNGESGYKDAMNSFSRRRKDEDSGQESSRSRRDRDSDYDTSRSKRHRSRSRERRYRDDDRHEPSSSRRDRDREYDRDRDRDKYRDRHKDRDRDKDERRHKDRR